jgi:hypothetical protein
MLLMLRHVVCFYSVCTEDPHQGGVGGGAKIQMCGSPGSDGSK